MFDAGFFLNIKKLILFQLWTFYKVINSDKFMSKHTWHYKRDCEFNPSLYTALIEIKLTYALSCELTWIYEFVSYSWNLGD